MTTEYSVKYSVQKYTGREDEGDIQFEVKEHIFTNFEDLKEFLIYNLPNEPISLQSREVTNLDFNDILGELYTLFYFGNGLRQEKSFKTFEEMNIFINKNKEYSVEKVKFPKSANWFNNLS